MSEPTPYPPAVAQRGACRGHTDHAMYEHRIESKRICLEDCPVLAECEAWVWSDPWARIIPGVVAGLTLTDRKPGCVVCGELFKTRDRIARAPFKPYCRAHTPDIGVGVRETGSRHE